MLSTEILGFLRGTVYFVFTCINLVHVVPAVCQDDASRSDLRLNTSSFQSYHILPSRYQLVSARTLLQQGLWGEGAAGAYLVHEGSLGFDLLAADPLSPTGGYWRGSDFDLFAVRYRDRPAPLLDQRAVPEIVSKKIAKALTFQYGRAVADTGDNLFGKLARLATAGVLPQRIVDELSNQRAAPSESGGVWPYRSRGGALLALRSKELHHIPRAIVCSNDIFADSEVIDSLAAVLHQSPVNTVVGEQRGALSDHVIPSPERFSFEERMGTRPLDPTALQEMLISAVRPGAPGVVIDESSDPRCGVGCHFEVRERAVRDFRIIERSSGVLASDLPFDMVVRYAELLAEVYGDTRQASEIREGLRNTEARLSELDAAFDAFQRAPPEQRNAALAAYRAARMKFRDVLHDEFLSRVSDLWKRIQLSKSQEPWVLVVKSFVVNVQRERLDPMEPNQALSSREFTAVALAQGPRQGLWTWLSREGDYPPDYVYVPQRDSDVEAQVARLLSYLKGCQPIESFVVKGEGALTPRATR